MATHEQQDSSLDGLAELLPKMASDPARLRKRAVACSMTLGARLVRNEGLDNFGPRFRGMVLQTELAIAQGHPEPEIIDDRSYALGALHTLRTVSSGAEATLAQERRHQEEYEYRTPLRLGIVGLALAQPGISREALEAIFVNHPESCWSEIDFVGALIEARKEGLFPEGSEALAVLSQE